MMIVVGETRLPRNLKRYQQFFGLLEIDCEPGKVPAKSRLSTVKQEAGGGLQFSLVLPSLLAAFGSGAEANAEWNRVDRIVDELAPTYWVVRTPAAVRPTASNRARLVTLFERLRQQAQFVVWEPGGVWDDRDAARFCEENGITFAQDVSQGEPVPARDLYCRVRAFGRGAHVGLGLAERIVERAVSFERASIVVEGKGAANVVKAAQMLGTLSSLGPGELDEDDETESEELEDDENEQEELD